jgi:hypothetical protein
MNPTLVVSFNLFPYQIVKINQFLTNSQMISYQNIRY